MGRGAGVSSHSGDVLEPEVQSRPRPGRPGSGGPPVPGPGRGSQESSPVLYRQQLIGSRRGVKE